MRSLLFLVAMSSVAYADRVVVITQTPELPTALQATARLEVVVQPAPAPDGDRVLDRAAAAQRLAIAGDAIAAVWIEGSDVWVVSADGRDLRHAALADPRDPSVAAALAASLLAELGALQITPPLAPQRAPAAPPSSNSGTVIAATPPSRPAPRFELAVGVFGGARAMSFDGGSSGYTLSYPYSGLDGISLHAAAFPRPEQPNGRDLTGIGLTLDLQKSIGASVSLDDQVSDTYGQYALDYTAWQLAAHYRHASGRVIADGSVSFGRASWTLDNDFPTDVPIPDTSYEYVGVGANLSYALTKRATIGAGAQYQYMLSTGDVSNADWYGSGPAAGYALDLDAKLPLGGALFLRATLEFHRVAMSFTPGNLYDPATDITDSWILAGAQIGATF